MAATKVSRETKSPIDGAPALIGGSLSALGRTLSRRVDDVVEAAGLSADQWYTLDVIIRNDGVAMNDLARSLSIPPPTVTKFVDRLVTKALVFRLVDHEDRRRLLVHAARRGSEVHAALAPAVCDVESAFLSELSATHRNALQALLATAPLGSES
ncbi:MarR family winged helix-turn-helix transcriptional regulator [Mycolicibacterium sp. S3B2]|uniref:MarR family winged helix-turn-helix transcriptional regulator n=1 Tax=Mycolicibacterium sp. S3B2 TaxID=3415120 RepID=UPI003C7BBC86